MAKKKKLPGAYRCQRYGILNPWGDVWSPETFDTMDEAQKYVAAFWSSKKDQDLSKFTVVPVKVTVVAVT